MSKRKQVKGIFLDIVAKNTIAIWDCCGQKQQKSEMRLCKECLRRHTFIRSAMMAYWDRRYKSVPISSRRTAVNIGFFKDGIKVDLTQRIISDTSFALRGKQFQAAKEYFAKIQKARDDYKRTRGREYQDE